MKYIRTKDGIYEVIGFDNECIIPSPIIKMNGKLTHCSDYKNCEQAGTIEELCDVIVETKGATGDYKHYIYEGERYEKLKPKIIDDIRTQDFNVYAGIWTDKGLIYVAKMNDKGELELLWN